MAQKLRRDKIPKTKEQLQEIMKCADDVTYFAKKYAYIPHPTRGLIKFEPYPYQLEALKMFQENRFNIVNKSRQLGFSTVTMVYSLWLALFYRNKNIVSIATKMSTAQNYISRLRQSLTKVPDWLFITEFDSNSKKEISFTNGSRIQAIPTSESSARGDSLSVLVLDECVDASTRVTVRNKLTGEITEKSIGELYLEMELAKG